MPRPAWVLTEMDPQRAGRERTKITMTKPYVVSDSKNVKVGEQCPTLGDFDTEQEAAEFISTLPEPLTGRYNLDGSADDWTTEPGQAFTYAEPCTSEEPDHPGLTCNAAGEHKDHYALGHRWSDQPVVHHHSYSIMRAIPVKFAGAVHGYSDYRECACGDLVPAAAVDSEGSR